MFGLITKRVNNIYNNIVTYSNITNVFDTLVKNINNKKYLYNYIKYKNCFIMDILETSIVNKEIDRVNKLNISSKEKDIKIKELRSIPLYKKGIGLSIGCLTNQILANFYLHDIDVYIKEKLKCKYYIRYMDDLIILDKDKSKLNKWFKNIESKLNDIDLEINKKSNIYKLAVGVSFLGYTYKVNNNKIIIKYNKKTISKINKRLKYLKKHNYNKYISSLNSYKGYFKRSNTNLYK